MDIDLTKYSQIVVLTGAGVSVASGIRTFRGPRGLWNDVPAQKLSIEAGRKNPEFLWQVFGQMRETVVAATPNAAHQALATMEQQLSPSQQFTLITQNVDGLHQRAGSKNVVELHGSLMHTRCSNPECDATPFEDSSAYGDRVPRCKICDAYLLPNVLLFGEPLPVHEEWLSKRSLRTCDLFIAVGTSGSVSPASNFVRSADYAGARTVLINLEVPTHPNPYCHEVILGPAEALLPTLLQA